MASNLVIDKDIHKNVLAYVYEDGDYDTIILCNNRSWDVDDMINILISTISHETIHLILQKFSIEDCRKKKDRVRMYRGIDYKFKKLNKRTMNDGDSYHGIDNVDEFLI